MVPREEEEEERHRQGKEEKEGGKKKEREGDDARSSSMISNPETRGRDSWGRVMTEILNPPIKAEAASTSGEGSFGEKIRGDSSFSDCCKFSENRDFPTSELIEKIIKANETERLTSYVEAGGINSHDAVKSMDKSKIMLSELECLLEDMESTMKTVDECPPSRDKEMSSGLDHQVSVEKGEMLSYGPEEPEIMDFAVLMGIIYSMLKQDYVMQERIVKGLNLKSSSGELESYSLMWSLRPFVKDEIMHQAWTYIP